MVVIKLGNTYWELLVHAHILSRRVEVACYDLEMLTCAPRDAAWTDSHSNQVLGDTLAIDQHKSLESLTFLSTDGRQLKVFERDDMAART